MLFNLAVGISLLAMLMFGIILGRLTRYDSEVIMNYREKEVYQTYMKCTKDLHEKIQDRDDMVSLILKLDSVAILSAYNRDNAMKYLVNNTNHHYSAISNKFEAYQNLKVYDLLFQRLRLARVKILEAIGRVYRCR